MSFLQQLEWRWATKSFDSSKTISDEHLQQILKAVKLAPTSFGLQPFRVYIVSDEKMKAGLSEAAFGQPQPKEAPYTLVFCADQDVDGRVESYIDLNANGDSSIIEKMAEFKNMVKGMVSNQSAEAQGTWAAKQAYIALGFAMAACAELQIDSCPMEGFRADAIDQLLELPPNLKTHAMLSIGYRSAEPARSKFRFTDELLFIRK